MQRIQQVKLQQQRRSVEDLMYASILHKFVSHLKVDLLPSLDGVVEIGQPPFCSSPSGAPARASCTSLKAPSSAPKGM
jgi:hypothetical protein